MVSLEPTSCSFHWTPIPIYQRKGLLLGYRIEYTSLNHSTNPSNVTTSSEKTNFVLSGLKPYTNYSIKLAELTSKGTGNYSSPVECFTMGDSK